MRILFYIAILVLAATLAVPARAANPPNPMPPASILRETLPNGATIIVRKDPAAPMVTADLWISAGAADDGGTGAAHAVEHMLFKGSRVAPNERVDAAVEDTGAVLSASTLPDASHFWATTTAGNLPVILGNLVKLVREPALEPVAWERERKVITEEIVRAKAELTAETRRMLTQKLYGPSGAPVSGTLESLTGLTPDILRNFHRDHYRPDKMTLVIVGGLEPTVALAQARAALSPLPAETAPPPRTVPARAKATMAETTTEGRGRIAVGIGFSALAGSSAALDIACAILRRRLERVLAGAADNISVAHPWQSNSVVLAVVEGPIAEKGHLLTVLRTESAQLAESITEPEIRQAVRNARWRWWLDHESPVSQARTLGMAQTMGDLEEATLAQARLGILTIREIREAARVVFAPWISAKSVE